MVVSMLSLLHLVESGLKDGSFAEWDNYDLVKDSFGLLVLNKIIKSTIAQFDETLLAHLIKLSASYRLTGVGRYENISVKFQKF